MKGMDVKRLIVLFALFTLVISEPIFADNRYVIDELIITVRSGRTNQHNIIKLLHSGAKVEVLEEVDDNDRLYARIRAGDIEGWVHSQYLSAEPIARDRIEAMRNKLQASKDEVSNLKQQLAVLRQKYSETRKQRDALDGSAESLDKELQQLKRVAAKPVEIAELNKQLRTELSALKKEYAVIEQDHTRIKQSNERDWFIAGAGVVILSIVFGILLTRIRIRRRKNWRDSI